MWKKPAAASLLALGLAASAAAQDVGMKVGFSARPLGGMSFWVATRAASVIFETGESDAVSQPWDSVLIQGESPDQGVDFEFSRRLASGAWGAWTPAQITRRTADGRFWARARLAKASPGSLRLRGLDAGVQAGHWLEIYTVEAFDSGAVTQDAPGPAPAEPPSAPPAPRPLVHGRQEWAAREPKEPYTPHAPDRLTLHHTA